MGVLTVLREWAARLRQNILTVYFAARDAQAPRHLRLLALAVAAYAISPIDLVPDFIPVLGYLDDLILVPLGISAVLHWMPPAVIEAARLKAAQTREKFVSHAAAAVVIGLWMAALWLIAGRWLA